MPLALAICVYVVLLPLGARLLNDPDTYSHIAMGRWLIEHRTYPTGDPFSHSKAGSPWAAFEWGSQLLLYAAYALAGWSGVVALAAAAIASAFGLLTHFLRRHLAPTQTMILLLAAFILLTPHLLARPHVLAFPFLVAWVGTLLAAAETERSPPWWLLAVMVVWANLHGSFTFGLVMLGPIAAEAVLRAAPGHRRRLVGRWAAFGALALAAAAVTPYGPELMLVTHRTMALGDVLTIAGEWLPQDFAKLGPFEILLLAGFGLALSGRLTLPPLRVLTLLGLIHLALAHVRFADLLGLLGPLVIAAPLGRQLGTAPAAETRWPHKIEPPPLAAICAVMLCVTAALAHWRPPEPAAENTPAAAIAATPLTRTAPILNHYNFGGYLDFVGIRPFIDGRAEAYGADFIMRYHRATMGEDADDLARLLQEYRIGVTLFPPASPAVGLLDRMAAWRRAYADDIAVVHERIGKAAQADGLRGAMAP